MLRYLWKRLLLRNLTQTGSDRRIDNLYLMPDPWNLSSSTEQARYHASNRIIQERFPAIQSVLEIGSAEGLQTSHLLRIAPMVQCVEVSSRAADRARSLHPTIKIYTGDAKSFEAAQPGFRADLATAFEVLYYPTSPHEILGTMSRLATYGIASTYSKYADLIRPHMLSRFRATEDVLSHNGMSWVFWSWSNKKSED